jgi:hypothetical protein
MHRGLLAADETHFCAYWAFYLFISDHHTHLGLCGVQVFSHFSKAASHIGATFMPSFIFANHGVSDAMLVHFISVHEIQQHEDDD